MNRISKATTSRLISCKQDSIRRNPRRALRGRSHLRRCWTADCRTSRMFTGAQAVQGARAPHFRKDSNRSESSLRLHGANVSESLDFVFTKPSHTIPQ